MTKRLLQTVRSARLQLLTTLAALVTLVLPSESSALVRQNPASGSLFSSEWETCRNDPVNNSDPLGLSNDPLDYGGAGYYADRLTALLATPRPPPELRAVNPTDKRVHVPASMLAEGYPSRYRDAYVAQQFGDHPRAEQLYRSQLLWLSAEILPMLATGPESRPLVQGVERMAVRIADQGVVSRARAKGVTVVAEDTLASMAVRDATKTRRTLFHYTNEKGIAGITESQEILPSLKSLSPNDVRYGNGQYLSDIVPGTKTPAQLSREFIGQPFQGSKYTHFIEVDVHGLNVMEGRPGVFVIPNDTPLDIVGRIINSGKVAP